MRAPITGPVTGKIAFGLLVSWIGRDVRDKMPVLGKFSALPPRHEGRGPDPSREEEEGGPRAAILSCLDPRVVFVSADPRITQGERLSENPFRYRGLKVVIDTTEKAEFDAAGLRLGDTVMERIGRELLETSFSPRDRVVGDLRVREIQGYDVAFVNGREDGTLVITIGRIERPDPANPLEDVLKKLEPLAIFRGASGI